MCGIAGYSHLHRPQQRADLERSLASIAHRGPDQQGVFYSNTLSMGARRLRVMDIECGDQPFSSFDGDITLVFNGEIFNHRELRVELEAAGYTFRSHCDTEVVLHAFQHWGNAAFKRFRGMFAAALWIRSERRLVLARDRMGIKPLYYCQQDGEIYFGSEMKCIFAHSAVERRLSVDGLNCFLSLNYVPGPFTMIEGIFKLMPGHMLEWQSGQAEIHSYLTPHVTETAPSSLDEAAEELDTLMSQSVTEQLDSDAPLGLWLSGGLDSSTILHYASEASAKPLQTFSITFNGRSFNDGNYIHEVSQRYGSQHTELDLNGDCDLVGSIENIAYHADEPNADAGAVPIWFLSQMTRQHVTVSLSGEGADELFAGYLTHKADRYAATARRVPAWMRKSALACARLLPVSDEKIGLEYKVKRFLEGSLLSPEYAHIFWNGTFSEAEKATLFHHSSPKPLAGIVAGINSGQGLERFLRFDQSYYLPDDILSKVDRMSMAHAVEVRPPFLDSRIVDFAARLPERFKLRGSTSKLVLRHLMRNKLPNSVLTRPKIGLDIPIHDWFRGPLRGFLQDTLSRDAILDAGVFAWPAVEQIVGKHLRREANYGYHLWGLVTLLTWMKRWDVLAPGATQQAEPVEQAEAFPYEMASSL
jgi:asparagine synthase (glutamine-hydrolysing)